MAKAKGNANVRGTGNANMNAKAHARVKAKQKLALTGRVFCSWNAFSFSNPVPDRSPLQAGDLIIWSWSGDRSNRKSRPDHGFFGVSVIDRHGARRRLAVKHTRVSALLRFQNDSERESKLSQLVAELSGLQGRTLTRRDGAYQVDLIDLPAPPAPARLKQTTLFA